MIRASRNSWWPYSPINQALSSNPNRSLQWWLCLLLHQQSRRVIITINISKKIPADSMGEVDFFLGTSFTWQRHESSNVSVHHSQSAFTKKFMGHRFSEDKTNLVPNITMYCSGYPIDYMPAPDPNNPNLKRHVKVYQSIVGSINLACTLHVSWSGSSTYLLGYL